MGNHTWSHRLLLAVNERILKQEIYDFDQYFNKNFNYSMKFFRPPWGIITKKSVNIIEKHYGYKIFNWNKDSLDYLLPYSRNIHKIITPKFSSDPLIILFHDGNILSPISTRKYTLKSVEKLIQLKNENVDFTLPDFM